MYDPGFRGRPDTRQIRVPQQYAEMDPRRPFNDGQDCIPERNWAPGIDAGRNAARMPYLWTVAGQTPPFDRVLSPSDFTSIAGGATGTQVTFTFQSPGYVVGLRAGATAATVTTNDLLVRAMGALQFRIEIGGANKQLIASATGAGWVSLRDAFGREMTPLLLQQRINYGDIWNITLRNVDASQAFTPSMAMFFQSEEFMRYGAGINPDREGGDYFGPGCR